MGCRLSLSIQCLVPFIVDFLHVFAEKLKIISRLVLKTRNSDEEIDEFIDPFFLHGLKRLLISKTIKHNKVALFGLTANWNLFWPAGNKREFAKTWVVFFLLPRSHSADIFHEDTVLAYVVLSFEIEDYLLVVILTFANVDVEGSENTFLQIVNVTSHCVQPVLVFADIWINIEESPVYFFTKFGPYLVFSDEEAILLNVCERFVENLTICYFGLWS